MSPAKQRLQNISSYQKKRQRGKNGFCFEYIVALVKRYLGKYVSLCPKVYNISLVPGSKHCFLESRGQPEREKRGKNKSGAGTERLQVRFIVISWRIRFAGNKIFAFLPTVRCTTDTIQRRF